MMPGTAALGPFQRHARCSALHTLRLVRRGYSSKFTTFETQASYGLGLNIGADLASRPFSGMSHEAILEGLADGLKGAPSQVPFETLQQAFVQAQEMMKKEEAAANPPPPEEDAFLKANGARDGVTTTASGLQYEVLTQGSGATPGPDYMVKVHYEGKTTDGIMFDSSYKMGMAIEFPLQKVIKGWQEALCMMPCGSKWRLWVPHHLGYGDRAIGETVKPYSTLVFEVELLETWDEE